MSKEGEATTHATSASTPDSTQLPKVGKAMAVGRMSAAPQDDWPDYVTEEEEAILLEALLEYEKQVQAEGKDQ